MSKKISCFLPCRKGSERVPHKNIKPFANFSNGLIEIKLKQLIACSLIDEIVLSTNDDEIIDFASRLHGERIRIHRRDEELSSSQTSTDDLVMHAASLIDEGHILWTHVTSPFITASIYDGIIRTYFDMLNSGYDSLMTTTSLYGFLWKNSQPINYDRLVEKWPRTQTLIPLDEVNSGAFMASVEIFREQRDRIGKNPFLYRLNKLVSHDIDWPEDFVIAECMVEKNLVDI